MRTPRFPNVHNIEEISQTVEGYAKLSVEFIVLLSLSAIIATLGLIANSVAGIIGAMIIAPLMQPINALAFAVVTAERLLLRRALTTVATGCLLTVAIAYLTDSLIGTHVVGSEIISRSKPTLIDLGVAMAAGIAGTYALLRKNLRDSIAGVAIAVALVPPLCVVGIGLSLGSEVVMEVGTTTKTTRVVPGSALLFLTNISSMVFCGGLVFLIHGYGEWIRSRNALVGTGLLLILLAIPLTATLDQLLMNSRIRQASVDYGKSLGRRRLMGAHMTSLQTLKDGEVIRVDMELVAPNSLDVGQEGQLVRRYLEKSLNRPIELKLRVINFNSWASTQEQGDSSNLDGNY